MHSRIRSIGIVMALIAGMSACDKKAPAESTKSDTKAKPEAKADDTKAKAKDDAKAKADDTKAKADDAKADAEPAPDARVTATIENNFPKELAADATAPTGKDTIEFGLVQVTPFPGMKVKSTKRGKGDTYEISGTPGPVAAYAHNPAGDDGEDCPTLEDIEKLLGDAQVDVERRFAADWSGDGPMFGAESDVLIFHQGDNAGFYTRSRFDHGDDYTDFCAATGTPQAPVANVTPDEAKALAGSFATARENL